jgi:hypothetical protein
MPVARHLQTTLSAGEFDPLLWAREDVTFFYNSARIIENAVPLPQGGAKRREGWKFRAMQRGPLASVSLGSATITAPNGGTVANLRDGLLATLFATSTAIGVTATYEVFRIDFGSAQALSMLDARRILILNLPSAFESVQVALQTSPDAVTWTTVQTLRVGNIAYDRRFSARPDQRLATARYWRLVVLNTGDLLTATVRIADLSAWLESGYSTGGTVPGAFNFFRMTPSVTEEFGLVMTAGNVDIFTFPAGDWVAAVPVPHSDSEVARVKDAPNLDTALFYHQDRPVHQIQRLSGVADWRSAQLTFQSVARLAFETGTNTGGVNEKQVINVGSMATGNKLVVEYNGQTSPEITWTANEATNAAAVQAAIIALDDIASVAVTVYEGTGLNASLLVEFTGVDGKRSWPVLVYNILTGTGTMTVDRLQYGQPDTDDLWSATRGYPSCGGFYQGRHWMGGFRSRPDILAASRAGAYLDFKLDNDPIAGSPILIAPNVDDQISIEAIFPGRHLQIFTSSTEFYVPDEPITIDNIALKATSRFGANSFTKPLDVQGGTLFVDRNGRAVREYLYTDTEASYSAEPISIMAGHLVSSPRYLCLRRSQNVDKPTLLLLANTGTDRFGGIVPAAFCVIDRAQQVTGFVRVLTQGTPLGFATSQAGDALCITRRALAGIPWNYIEAMDESHMSDASIFVENPNLEEFTATGGQTVFTYTFTSPVAPLDVAVWTFNGVKWVRAGATDYALDLTAKTVTFSAPRAAGDLVRINLRMGMIDVTAAPFLEGVSCYVHGDGLPIGEFVPDTGAIDIGDRRFDFRAEVGLMQKPRIVLHPYKGKGDQSPTMRNMRIFQALLQLERTGAITIGQSGQRLRPVPLQVMDSGVMDLDLEEVLFTGAKRVAGLGHWTKEPCLEFSQDEPMPFLLRSITYDVRF